MLSAFPDLFTYSLFAPFILRLVLAFYIVTIGQTSLKKQNKGVAGAAPSASDSIVPEIPWIPYKKETIYGYFNIAIAVLLFIGLFTQVAALIAFLIIVLEWRIKKQPGVLWQAEHISMLLAGAIAISLLFLGAGFFAIDWPL